jgi:hypothetical protein
MQSLRATARYWGPIVVGFSCLIVATTLSSVIAMLVLYVVGLFLMMEGLTKAWERNGGRDGLSENKQ